jgi:hypothetical protein
VGGIVAVVRALASLTTEDDCAFSCNLARRLAAPASECVLDPPPVGPFSVSVFSDKFASAAPKVMPVGLAGSRAAATVEDVVVDEDAIRTPLMMHVACQHLAFAT